ncbi:MAG: SDR family oxidoreductase [Candidatus Dormibacteraeota bacterium]|nr:SDR family oxidoreductase [Candidatus Dormibacteraeota bacterium]
MTDLAGRVALVTGGGRGIGRATAIALAQAGADVAVVARSRTELDETAEAVRSEGRRGEVFVCDVTQRADVDATLVRARETLGEPLILVNNAGIATGAKLADTTDELWARTMQVNVTAAFYWTRAVMPLMLAAGWGRVINVASIAAKAAAPYMVAYAASKHALLGLTRAVSSEVASRGITVNAICPGYVDTAMTAGSIQNINARTGRSPEQSKKILEGFSPQARLMSAEEVAGLAAFLCTEAARGINGQGIVLDGGGVQG